MDNGYRLLIVEDDPLLCDTLADLLRYAGYDVVTANDGETALRLLREAPRPDAILLDLVLPRMSAERFLRLAAGACDAEPPVVLMTGMVPPPGAAPAAVTEVLEKPFGVDQLLGRLAAACAAGRSGLHALPPRAAAVP